MSYYTFLAHLDKAQEDSDDYVSLVNEYPDYYERYQCENVRRILTKHAEDYAHGTI